MVDNETMGRHELLRGMTLPDISLVPSRNNRFNIINTTDMYGSTR